VELDEFMCGIDGRIVEERAKGKVGDLKRFCCSSAAGANSVAICAAAAVTAYSVLLKVFRRLAEE
jgi:hypothetical protein